ncbi:MAG: hypothetical protein IPI35_32290 [Deltaproteobacteria bacterium]|nr:hypothetical protein [Deltaproteobacteria bacterium]
MSRGPGRRALRRGLLLALEPAAFDALIERAVNTGEVQLDGPRLRRPGFAPSLVGEDLAAWTTLLGRLAAAGLGAPEPRELTEGLTRGEALLNLCFEEGRVETLEGRPTDKAALDTLIAQVRQVLAEEGQLTPARFRAGRALSKTRDPALGVARRPAGHPPRGGGPCALRGLSEARTPPEPVISWAGPPLGG